MRNRIETIYDRRIDIDGQWLPAKLYRLADGERKRGDSPADLAVIKSVARVHGQRAPREVTVAQIIEVVADIDREIARLREVKAQLIDLIPQEHSHA